jgi:hypothetical protein
MTVATSLGSATTGTPAPIIIAELDETAYGLLRLCVAKTATNLMTKM